jgi:putative heme-binding domain-containing protein
VAILDPSIEIREGFGAYICKLKDGQVQMGMLEKQDATGVVLKDLAGQRHSIRQSEIASLDASPVSVMPEGLLQGLSDSNLRDLFSYLRKP